MRESCRDFGKEGPDVVHQVRGGSRLLDNPPYDERNRRPLEDRLEFHCRLPGSADFSIFLTFFIYFYLNITTPPRGRGGGGGAGAGWGRWLVWGSGFFFPGNLVALRMRLSEEY